MVLLFGHCDLNSEGSTEKQATELRKGAYITHREA